MRTSGGTGEYSVRAVVNGIELKANKVELTMDNNYIEISLQNAPDILRVMPVVEP